MDQDLIPGCSCWDNLCRDYVYIIAHALAHKEVYRYACLVCDCCWHFKIVALKCHYGLVSVRMDNIFIWLLTSRESSDMAFRSAAIHCRVFEVGVVFVAGANLFMSLPRDTMLARYMQSSCVCMSVRLSHAGIVYIQRNYRIFWHTYRGAVNYKSSW